jgi:hypothetical protein
VNKGNTPNVRASDPVTDGKLPHLKISLTEKLPGIFFLPGDPARIGMFEDSADAFASIGGNREFALAKGTYKGIPFGVCSTGIGGGSTEICVVELARLGVRVMIRTGGCGALLPDIACGEYIINSGGPLGRQFFLLHSAGIPRGKRSLPYGHSRANLPPPRVRRPCRYRRNHQQLL